MTVSAIKAGIKGVLKACLNASAPLYSRVSTMDASSARETLNRFSPKPAGTPDATNLLLGPRCDLQIVIPAYNVESYLAKCMDSVLGQETKYTYHVVLVDDGSTDSTPAIADRYAADSRVTVIHQENRGFSGARNVGLSTLFGSYIMFVDSDDYLPQGAVETLLDTAFTHGCDIVEGGAYYLIDESLSVMHRYRHARAVTDPCNVLHGQPWAKVYKRDLFETICFPEGYWYEDSILSFLIYPKARKVYTAPGMVYVYRINPAGIVKTSHGKPKSVDTYYITEALLSQRAQRGLSPNEAFFRSFLLQVRLNQHRVADLPENIQESVFVLTCDLFRQAFPSERYDRKSRTLLRALQTRDFGMYRACCRIF